MNIFNEITLNFHAIFHKNVNIRKLKLKAESKAKWLWLCTVFSRDDYLSNFKHMTSKAKVAFVFVFSMRDLVSKMVWMACCRRNRE